MAPLNQLGIKLPEETKAFYEKVAEQNLCSLSSIAKEILTQFKDAYERKHGKI